MELLEMTQLLSLESLAYLFSCYLSTASSVVLYVFESELPANFPLVILCLRSISKNHVYTKRILKKLALSSIDAELICLRQKQIHTLLNLYMVYVALIFMLVKGLGLSTLF